MSTPDRTELNFAIVGLGKIGIMHAAMVRNVPGARLAALVERVPQVGRHVQSMMGSPVPLFRSIEEALQQVPLQGVWVCTPQFTHRSVAETCLAAGLDVFVEKPLAHTLADAAAMVKAAHRRRQAVNAVGFMKAHEGFYEEIERLLRAQALGELRGFEATCYLSQVFGAKKGWIYTRRLSGGGIVMNSTCHVLHSLHRLLGPLQALTAECRSVYSNEVEDEATMDLEFALARGRIHTSWSKPGYDVETSTIHIFGDAGTLEIQPGGFRLELRRPGGGYQAGVHIKSRTEFDRSIFNLSPGYGGEGYYREDEDFVSACMQRRGARVGWDEALIVQQMIDAIYRSQGQRIDFPGEHQTWQTHGSRA